MNKKEKKEVIKESVDLANGRFKDSEVDALYDMVTNREKYDGQSKTIKHSFDDFSSDGKYHRDEETTYTLRDDDKGLRVERNYSYEDDDGQSGMESAIVDTARGILNLISLFKK